MNFLANLTILPLIQVSLGYWLAVHPILVSRGLVNSAEKFLIFAMPGDPTKIDDDISLLSPCNIISSKRVREPKRKHSKSFKSSNIYIPTKVTR